MACCQAAFKARLRSLLLRGWGGRGMSGQPGHFAERACSDSCRRPNRFGCPLMTITPICDRCHRNQFGHYGALQADTMFLFHRHEHALPFISWRNPVMPPRRRTTKYCGAISKGRKYMVLERACLNDNWVVVTVLTVLDGRPQVAA